MFHIFKHRPPLYTRFSENLLWSGLFCVIMGIAILSVPELLEFLVSVAFLVLGISFLTAWWKMKKMGGNQS
ncbi:MAG: hypothetical protein QF755_06790 [Candidatus Peribacteraceae bacterium]|nr:hypothetical protein [Candidatus Peribacteraceae bacterium]HCI03613.1 hypothetical protein [Candidatus Peribacteria bacterium]